MNKKKKKSTKSTNNNTPCNKIYKGTYGHMCYKENCYHFGLWYCLNHKKYCCYKHMEDRCR